MVVALRQSARPAFSALQMTDGSMNAQARAKLGAAAAARRLDGPTAALGQWTALTLLGLLCCAALLIGWRRLAGAISVPLEPLLLLSAGGLSAMAAVGIRLVHRRLAARRPDRRADWPIRLLTSGAVVALGTGLSLGGTDAWGLTLFWTMLIGEELWAWRPATWRNPPPQRDSPAAMDLRGIGGLQRPAANRPPQALTEGMPGEDVSQKFTRSQAADGSELLSGWLRAGFAVGQRTATVHLAFCPQLAGTPELTVEQLDGPEILRINKAVFPFGARLDLKLVAPAEEPVGVLLQFSARSRPPSPAN
jgi:hypothetical protein